MLDPSFIHVRAWTKPRGFLTEEKKKNKKGEFISYPFLSNFGGATIAYKVVRQADGLYVEYAVAECHETDRFRKALGRTLATSRLNRAEICGVIQINADMEDDLQEMIVEDYFCAKELAIKNSVNGGWVDAIELRDYYQPVHPGYVWNINGDKEDE